MASLAATATAAGQIMQGAMPRLAAATAGGAPAIFEVAAAGFGKVPLNPNTALMTAAALGTVYGVYKGFEWYQDRERAKESQAAAEREDLKQAYESSHFQQGQAWLQRHTYNLAAADTAIPGVYNPSTDKGKERVSGSSISHCETTDPVEGWVDQGFDTHQGEVNVLSTPMPEPARPDIEGFDPAPSSIGITLGGFDVYDGPQIQILTNEDLIYKGAPYHHSNSQGYKSRAPSHPQATLEQSIVYDPANPRRRVAVDSQTGEFVVFNNTNDGTWHGHVRTWDSSDEKRGLDQKMKNALIKAGKVTKKGKIISQND